MYAPSIVSATAEEHGNTVIPTRALGLLMMSGVESRRTRIAGWVVLALGIVALLLSVVPVSRTHTVIDTAFTVEAGEKCGPMDGKPGTRYYPPTDCALTGKVAVEGEGIYFAASLLGWDFGIENVFVDSEFTFIIDPAWGWDHIYCFTFDNTAGDAESHVTFVLEETLTGSPLKLLALFLDLRYDMRMLVVVLGVISFVFLLPVGCTVIVWDFIRRRRRARLRKLALGE